MDQEDVYCSYISATIWIQVGSLTSQSLHFGVFLSVDFTDITDPNKSKNINTENVMDIKWSFWLHASSLQGQIYTGFEGF